MKTIGNCGYHINKKASLRDPAHDASLISSNKQKVKKKTGRMA